ncbi:hypothetical protein M2451_003765 [Dysgonomonas sp. PFB1-18]|nr:hypothetical protein [Dysgonomonas sp. PF1-14]MDH6340790.1 hypothetical protein [Dysgonomonas sp. PF1-16]MDH6382424.1 hypothetical protein [Dysgonomonas sp. PFB1-18]MDH6399759.1 hypothetical protein [Dysgonomonas sp. PF1-23]
MNELLKMRLFSLLSEPSQVANEEMQNAYGCFIEQLRRVSQSENNIEVFRMLSFTRIELVALQTFYQHEQGGKCPEICLP